MNNYDVYRSILCIMYISTHIRYNKFALYNLACRACQKDKFKAETYPNKLRCRIREFNDSEQEHSTSHPGLLGPVTPYVTIFTHGKYMGRTWKENICTELFNCSCIHLVISASEYYENFMSEYIHAYFNCRRGRFWWRRKCRAKYRGPWWRWPAVSVTVTYAEVHDWVGVDSDDTQWSDATLCYAIQHGHLVEVDRLRYSSDSTLYNKMPVGKLVKSRTSRWFCRDTCNNYFEVFSSGVNPLSAALIFERVCLS
jgi:hypothetical protein